MISKGMAGESDSSWPRLVALLERFATAPDASEFLDDALDSLVEFVGADRGLIFRAGNDGAGFVVQARGKHGALSPEECEEVSRTVIRRALTQQEVLRWSPLEEDDGSASMAEWGILGALAVRLQARGSSDGHGVLYLDFRDPLRPPSESHAEMVGAVGALMGAMLDRGEELAETREQLRSMRSSTSGAGTESPSLDEFLAPLSMRALREDVAVCLQSSGPILIQGESGSGKTLLAARLAEASSSGPIVRAVLGASDDLNTITSELFGHEKGAFSGALSSRKGLVAHADGGTLILDEILNLPLSAQQLLLDFTQFNTYRPLGFSGPQPKIARVRLIAATNQDLQQAVKDGRFREDLYYRLAGTTLRVPSLRERATDVAALADGFLRSFDPQSPKALSPAVRKLLVSEKCEWPGNIRQLESAVRRMRDRAHLRGVNVIEVEDLRGPDVGLSSQSEQPGQEEPFAARWEEFINQRGQLEDQERKLIEESLFRSGGVVASAARELGLSRTSLVSRIQTLGIARK